MTEHGASIFVFFFLGEYSSLILMSTFMSIFFLGGYHCPDLYKLIFDPLFYFYNDFRSIYNYFWSTDIYLILYTFYDKSSIFYFDLWNLWNSDFDLKTSFSSKDIILGSVSLLIDKIYGSYVLGFKIITVVFFYIWVRASFPRLRYDQLMSLCWKELLPLAFAYILFAICLFYTFDMMPFGISF